eukprot:scaffold151883_cov28-Tisochrysis_lutea.AAC.3
MEVVDAGTHGFISIFDFRPLDLRRYSQLLKQPGWEARSFAYHGDDGCAYTGCGYGRRFAQTFGTGQVRCTATGKRVAV